MSRAGSDFRRIIHLIPSHTGGKYLQKEWVGNSEWAIYCDARRILNTRVHQRAWAVVALVSRSRGRCVRRPPTAPAPLGPTPRVWQRGGNDPLPANGNNDGGVVRHRFLLKFQTGKIWAIQVTLHVCNALFAIQTLFVDLWSAMARLHESLFLIKCRGALISFIVLAKIDYSNYVT